LEAYLRLVHRDVVALGQAVGHRGRGERAHGRPAQAAHLQQVQQQQRVHLELVHEAALLVYQADAVGVAVRADPAVGAAAAHRVEQQIYVRRDRLGPVQAGEVRVYLVVYGHQLDAAAGEYLREVADARAVHRVVHDLQPARSEALQVDEPAHLRQVRGARVDRLDAALGSRLVQWETLHAALGLVPADVRLQLGHDLRRGRARIPRLVLEAVVRGGVVARRDDHAAARLPVQHRERDDRRGLGAVAQVHPHVVRGRDFGHRGGETVGGKARVVADHQAICRLTR